MRRRLRIVPATLTGILGLPEMQGPIVLQAGLSQTSATDEWLVPSASAISGPLEQAGRLLVVTRSAKDDWNQVLRQTLAERKGEAPTAALILGRGPTVGTIAGACLVKGAFTSLDELILLGPGLPAIDLSSRLVSTADARRILAAQPAERLRRERWSRTIGALGLTTWRRLSDLSCAIVGCGRSGSLVASHLVRSGLRRLTLIDPDLVEPHNVGEMDLVTPADAGRPKVEVLSAYLSALADITVEAVAGRIDLKPAFSSAKQSDVLISCADDTTARWLTAVIGAAYLRPVLDIGSGVFERARGRQLGVDVRLVLPGRCLMCFGGLAQPAQIDGSAPPTANQASEVWQRQRSGSLRSLNQVAVGLAMRLMEDLVGGRITHSTWIHVEFDAEGMPRLERVRPPRVVGCPVCAVSGAGDGLLLDLPALRRRTIDRADSGRP